MLRAHPMFTEDERDALDQLFDLWEKFPTCDRTPTPMLCDRNLPEANCLISQKSVNYAQV
jgi:hypothetical protein